MYTSCALEFELACNDDSCDLQSEITWPVSAGTSYFVRVSGYNGNTGDYELELTCATAGDECWTCTPVTEGRYTGSTAGNTGATDDTACTTGDTIDRWFCYTASCAGTAIARTCGPGTLFDTSLAVFDDCSLEVAYACNDDTCGLQSEVSWPVVAGGSYLIRLSGYFGASGDYELTIACGNGVVMDDPLDAMTSNAAFAPGEIHDWLAFQSNLDAAGLSGPNPRGTSGLAAVGPGVIGAVENAVLGEHGHDSFDAISLLPIPLPQPTVVALSVVSLSTGATMTVSVFDTNDALLGQLLVPAGPTPTFVAATPIALPSPIENGGGGPAIGRINLWQPINGLEGLYEMTVYGSFVPCAEDCAAPADGFVDVLDLLQLLLQWGQPGSCDNDQNNTVDVLDLLDLLTAWGSC